MTPNTMVASPSAPFAIPSFSSRARAALGALATLARDPGRLDQVLVLTQAVNAPAIRRAATRLGSMPGGERLLAERPRIDRVHVDYAALERLPDGTLGREYVRFLKGNGIGPEPFEHLPDVGDERAAWIMLRLRQTHDLWHVLTGYAPDVRGEVLLQAFTYAQLGAPSAALLAIFGTLRWLPVSRAHLRDLRDAYRHGKRAAFLPTFRWEEHWASPVSTLRTTLDCPAVARPASTE